MIDLRWIKYIMLTKISKRKNLLLRKRLLHKGYQLIAITDLEHIPTYVHITYIDTLRDIERYLKKEYNLKIKL